MGSPIRNAPLKFACEKPENLGGVNNLPLLRCDYASFLESAICKFFKYAFQGLASGYGCQALWELTAKQTCKRKSQPFNPAC